VSVAVVCHCIIVDEVVTRQQVRREIWMCVVRAGVDGRYDRSRAAGNGPGRDRAGGREMPLPADEWVTCRMRPGVEADLASALIGVEALSCRVHLRAGHFDAHCAKRAERGYLIGIDACSSRYSGR
jgi:hypothetical protein